MNSKTTNKTLKDMIEEWNDEFDSITKDWQEQLDFRREKNVGREFTTKKSALAEIKRIKDDQDFYGDKLERLIEKIDKEASNILGNGNSSDNTIQVYKLIFSILNTDILDIDFTFSGNVSLDTGSGKYKFSPKSKKIMEAWEKKCRKEDVDEAPKKERKPVAKIKTVAVKKNAVQNNTEEMEQAWVQEKEELLKLKEEKCSRLSEKVKAKYSSKLSALENEINRKKRDEKSRMAQIEDEIKKNQERLNSLGILSFVSRKSIGELIDKQKLELAQISSCISQIETDYKNRKKEIDNCIQTELKIMQDLLEDEFWIRENPVMILKKKQEIAEAYDRAKSGEYNDNDLEIVVYDILKKEYDCMTVTQIAKKMPCSCSTMKLTSVLKGLVQESKVTRVEDGGKALFVADDEEEELSEAALMDYETRRNRIEKERTKAEKECLRDWQCARIYQVLKDNEIAMLAAEIEEELGNSGSADIILSHVPAYKSLVNYGLIRRVVRDGKAYFILEQLFDIST